jgi:hypothetical protein
VAVRRVLDALAQRAHFQRRLAGEGRHRLVYHVRLDQGLVALHVHDEITAQRRRDFRQPIGATLVGVRRHPHLSAEG